jgi:hypothetical protein
MKKNLKTLELNQQVISKLNSAIIMGGQNDLIAADLASDSPTRCQTC